jgi:hypothetical protein
MHQNQFSPRLSVRKKATIVFDQPLLRGGVHRAIDRAEFVDGRAAVHIQFAEERIADATVKERVERSVGKPYIYSVAPKAE